MPVIDGLDTLRGVIENPRGNPRGNIEPRHVHEEKKQLRHNPYIDLKWQHCPDLLEGTLVGRSLDTVCPELMRCLGSIRASREQVQLLGYALLAGE